MDKNLKEQLKKVEQEFKSSNWRRQLILIDVLDSNEIEQNFPDEFEELIELFIDSIVLVNEFYLKTDFKSVDNLLTDTLTEDILIKGLINNIQDRWWIREFSYYMNEFNKEEIAFLLNEVINEVYIKRVHKSSKIILKRMNGKFDKEYNQKSIVKCIKLIDALIEKFLEKSLTFNSFYNYLNRETLFSPENIIDIINIFASYQTDLERVYIYYQINNILKDM